MNRNIINDFIVFALPFGLLSIVQLMVKNPMILLERFIEGGGWLEIFLLSSFAVFLYSKMKDPVKTSKWRNISWTIFSIVFFLQLIIGILWNDKFLMTSNIHLPVPAIILGGGLFRMEFSFMPILFIVTILLTGPAWCSQLCYFGAFDSLSARTKKKPSVLKNVFLFKNTILFIFIIIVLLLRFFDVSLNTAALFGGAFGIFGILIIIFRSPKKGSMIHCVKYCPIGTLVSYFKFVNPFRMYIDNNCDSCMACTTHCRYAALTKEDINKKRPGITCTYCGDCIPFCPSNSIKYKLFGLAPDKARNIYLIITISVFVVFLGLARM